jgi:molybdopterin synthase sulfur carrier subunit
MEVTVYGPLRGATGEKTVTVAFEGGTVADALDALVSAYPRAKQHLYDDGTLSASARISVNGDTADPDDDCPPDADVSIHPPMQGG